MQVQAISKNVRIAPRKAQEVMRQISGLPVEDAQNVLRFIPRKAARLIAKTLKSAIANAEDHARTTKIHLNTASLRVTRAEIGQGIAIKRVSTRARGSANMIRKRTSHIFVAVSDEGQTEKVKKAEPVKQPRKEKKK